MITPWEIALIAGMTAVTFGVRYATLAMVGRTPLPLTVERALKYVPVAVLTAIIVPATLMPTGDIDVSFGNAYLVAGLVAVGVSWRTKNLLLTIITGMAAFFLMRMI